MNHDVAIPRPPTDAQLAELCIELSAEERELLEQTHEVCRREILPARAGLDDRQEFPHQILAALREIGFSAAMFPTAYGGRGMGGHMTLLLLEAVAEYCMGVATILGVTTVLAPGPIEFGGTEEQKRRFLPRLAGGEWQGAFAMTEPDSGSDVFSLTTAAVKKGDRWILNGTKQWITNAGQADVYCIFALTRTDADPRSSLSCFVVEKDMPGLSFGKIENKLGIRCSHTRRVHLEDVEVPEENLLGLRPNHGLNLIFKSLARSRTMLAAGAVGVANAAYREALRYTVGRRVFGKRVADFQVPQHMLVDMRVKIDAGRQLAYRAGRTVWGGAGNGHVHAAMAKYHTSELAMQVATDALQLHGGYGFVKDNPIEKMFRDAKILAIYEGTSQMLKNEIMGDVLKEATQLR